MLLDIVTVLGMIHSMYATQSSLNLKKAEVKAKAAVVQTEAKLVVAMDKNELILKFGQPKEIILSRTLLNKSYHQMIYGGKYCTGNDKKFNFSSCWVILSDNNKVESWSQFKSEYQ